MARAIQFEEEEPIGAGILEQDDFDQLGVLGMSHTEEFDSEGSSDADDEDDDIEMDDEHDPGVCVPTSQRNSEQETTSRRGGGDVEPRS